LNIYPAKLEKKSLIEYCLCLGDSTLILGHRNSEWCGHGPILEQDIALTNISLDLIGQARNFYQYAALLKADGSTEDTLAYLRDPNEFTNCLLAEQPNGDWANTILRQFFFSNYQYLLYKELEKHPDEQIAAIAVKSLKEVTYHLRWSSEWVIRLGDGTEESHERMVRAIEGLYPFTGELFEMTDSEKECGPDLSAIKNNWLKKTEDIFQEATLTITQQSIQQTGGKHGNHSDHLTALLSEMQYLQRTYPNSTW
jgi:ring-1,2-phenylacetyl-CoA epoxidase subunit PaaC